jgi:hypothetical protein
LATGVFFAAFGETFFSVVFGAALVAARVVVFAVVVCAIDMT